MMFPKYEITLPMQQSEGFQELCSAVREEEPVHSVFINGIEVGRVKRLKIKPAYRMPMNRKARKYFRSWNKRPMFRLDAEFIMD